MTPFISNDVNQQVAHWSEGFAKAMDDTLRAIVLYGGLAKGEFVSGQSDVNILLVLRTINETVLDQAAPLVRQGALEFGLAAMLVTEDDLRDSADLFPIKFLDMQRRHRVLWGNDPFPGIKVPRERLRLRCEQELRNLSLRLRQSYMQRADRPELLQVALSRAVSSLLVNVGALQELKTGRPFDTKQDALDHAEQLGVPLQPVREAWALKQGETHPDPDALRKLFFSFMGTVQQFADLAKRDPEST